MPPLIHYSPPPQTEVPAAFPMGRLESHDPRDFAYRVRAVQPLRLGAFKLRKHRIFLPAAPPLRWRPQIGRGSCTEEAGVNKLCGWPHPRPLAALPFDHYAAYERAQELDEWPGSEKVAPFYEGSSGRAICRVFRELGLISAWWNAFAVDELRQLLLADTTDWSAAGPVTIGTNWYDSMFVKDEHGYLGVPPRARLVGGHQTLLIGANDNSETFYGINSWESMRLFRLRYETMRRLLEQEAGDAQFFVEVPLNPARTAVNPMDGILDFGVARTDVPTIGGSPLPPDRFSEVAQWAA